MGHETGAPVLGSQKSYIRATPRQRQSHDALTTGESGTPRVGVVDASEDRGSPRSRRGMRATHEHQRDVDIFAAGLKRGECRSRTSVRSKGFIIGIDNSMTLFFLYYN